MKKILLPFLLIIVLVGCENTDPSYLSEVDREFSLVQTDFRPYRLLQKDDGVYAFFYSYYYSWENDTNYASIKKSTDNGLTWEEICKVKSDSSQNLYIKSNDLYDFQIADDGAYWMLNGSGYLFKSTNNGAQWIRQNRPWGSSADKTEFELITPNLIHKDRLGVLYLYDFWKGIFRSSDNGVNWDYIVQEHEAYDYVQFFDDKIFYYIRNRDLMVSYDNGDSWIKPAGIETQDMEFSLDSSNKAAYYSMIEGYNSKLYFFITKYETNNFLLFESSDNGRSWSRAEKEMNPTYLTITKLIGADIQGSLYAFISPYNYSSSSYESEGVFKSTDNGDSWKQLLHMNTGWLRVITKEKYALFIDGYDELRLSKEKIY